MARKGTTATRRLKRGPNKGKTAKMVTIRDGQGNIRHSYRVYNPADYQRKKGR